MNIKRTISLTFTIIPLSLVALGIYEIIIGNLTKIIRVFPPNPITNYYGMTYSFIMFGLFFSYVNYRYPIKGLLISCFTYYVFEVVCIQLSNPLMIIFAFFTYYLYTYIRPYFKVDWKYLSIFFLVTLCLFNLESQMILTIPVRQFITQYFDIPYTLTLFLFILKSLKPDIDVPL